MRYWCPALWPSNINGEGDSTSVFKTLKRISKNLEGQQLDRAEPLRSQIIPILVFPLDRFEIPGLNILLKRVEEGNSLLKITKLAMKHEERTVFPTGDLRRIQHFSFKNTIGETPGKSYKKDGAGRIAKDVNHVIHLPKIGGQREVVHPEILMIY